MGWFGPSGPCGCCACEFSCTTYGATAATDRTSTFSPTGVSLVLDNFTNGTEIHVIKVANLGEPTVVNPMRSYTLSNFSGLEGTYLYEIDSDCQLLTSYPARPCSYTVNNNDTLLANSAEFVSMGTVATKTYVSVGSGCPTGPPYTTISGTASVYVGFILYQTWGLVAPFVFNVGVQIVLLDCTDSRAYLIGEVSTDPDRVNFRHFNGYTSRDDADECGVSEFKFRSDQASYSCGSDFYGEFGSGSTIEAIV